VKIQQVGRELGVRYVLEGSVRKSKDRIRVTAQLIDALTGKHLWAERYERELKDIFVIQDEVTKKIITALQVKLTEGMQARMYARGTENLEAYLMYLQGREVWFRMNKEDNALAREIFDEAIALDPKYPTLTYFLAWTHLADVWFGSSKSPKKSLELAFELAQKSLAMDDSHAQPYVILGYVYLFKKQYEKAIQEGERAVALAPNYANAYVLLGDFLRCAGRPQEGIQMIKKAFRLNPIPPNWYFHLLGLTYHMAGQYDEAVVEYEKALSLNPNSIIAHIVSLR